MTSIPIVDTHMHLWDPAHLSYAWLKEVQVLNRPFLLADYQRAMDSHQVAKMVFVQCEADQDQYVQEAEWVAALAKEDPRIAAIVPWFTKPVSIKSPIIPADIFPSPAISVNS